MAGGPKSAVAAGIDEFLKIIQYSVVKVDEMKYDRYYLSVVKVHEMKYDITHRYT